MAIVTTDDRHYKAIAEAIRAVDEGVGALANNFGRDTLSPNEMSDGLLCVVDERLLLSMEEGFSEGKEEGYQEGHAEGKAEGKEEGITEGIQTEYDRFWDAYQDNGNRTDYTAAFGGKGWDNRTFKPKYDIIVRGSASHMFNTFSFSGDLAQYLSDLGVELSLTDATSAHSLFVTASELTRVGVIDLRNCGAANSALFSGCSKLKTIDKIIYSPTNGTSTTYVNCTELENLTVEGTIGVTGMNLKWSTKLSKASITSVVNALSTTTSGLTVTFSKTAVNTAFATTAGGTDGSTSAEWTALVNTKKNWTIALA